MLTLDIAIVTRNRAQVLDLSLPLLLKQSRKPNAIIIVDSSDDPEAIANVVAAHSAATDVPIMFIQSDAGTSLQRNIALKHVKSDIVMFPDDDALLLPGALQAIMRIYEADIDERIGGVCGREVLEAPAGIMSATRKSHEMTRLDKLKLKISRVRWRIEKRLCPDPFIVHGRFRNAELGKINWLKEVNAVPVEFMNGFRMSFRTRLITKHGFDEALGRYALFEDIDASFSIMKTHHVVAALGAEIFHYKSSKKRDCGTVLARISHKAEAA